MIEKKELNFETLEMINQLLFYNTAAFFKFVFLFQMYKFD